MNVSGKALAAHKIEADIGVQIPATIALPLTIDLSSPSRDKSLPETQPRCISIFNDSNPSISHDC